VGILSETRLLAEGLCRLLRGRPGIAPFCIGPRACDAADVILIDAGRPDALACAARLKGEPFLFVNVQCDDDWAAEAVRAGAVGLLRREAPASELAHALAVVREGHLWLEPGVVKRALEAPTLPRAGSLTAREREIAEHTARGLSNKEVAHVMTISTATVKAHLTSVFRKLAVRDRAQLLVLYHGGPRTAGPTRPSPTV